MTYPRFRFGEIVRVLPHGHRSKEDLTEVLGREGKVTTFGPADDESWSVGVWFPDLEEMWGLDEDDVESLGVVEVEQDGAVTRLRVDPAGHEESFGGELAVRLLTAVGEQAAPRVVASAEAALQTIIPLRKVAWKGGVHWHPPYRYDIDLEVWTDGNSRDAFEALVASRSSGWVSQVDDGWGCHFWWRRADDESGEPFLVPEASDVAIDLTPWSDPSSRPIKKGRTHDPGLPGFTPPPPTAGYE
jgi:hypothetical protein